MRAARVLYVVAALLVLLGAGVRRTGLPVPEPQVEPVALPAPSTTGERKAETLLSFQGIIRANPLSPERVAPAARWLPPTERPEQEAAEVATAPPTPPRPRVFGTAVTADDAVALIDADPAIPGAEIYRIGDRLAGGAIISIDAASVTVGRGGDRHILRIEGGRADR